MVWPGAGQNSTSVTSPIVATTSHRLHLAALVFFELVVLKCSTAALSTVNKQQGSHLEGDSSWPVWAPSWSRIENRFSDEHHVCLILECGSDIYLTCPWYSQKLVLLRYPMNLYGKTQWLVLAAFCSVWLTFLANLISVFVLFLLIHFEGLFLTCCSFCVLRGLFLVCCLGAAPEVIGGTLQIWGSNPGL